MPQRLAEHDPRAPRWRIDEERPDEGHFFPGEVASLLGVPSLDHRQLRSIHDLVRWQAGTPVPPGVDQRGSPREKRWRWTRFTFLDVVATREVVSLCLTSDSELPDRLRLHRVRRACQALRVMGFENPLVELDLANSGDTIVVRMQDKVFDAETGQQRFVETEEDLKHHGLLEDPDLVTYILKVRAAFRATNPERPFEVSIGNISRRA